MGFFVSQLIAHHCIFSKIKTVSYQDSFLSQHAFFSSRKRCGLGVLAVCFLWLLSFVFKGVNKKEEVIFRQIMKYIAI